MVYRIRVIAATSGERDTAVMPLRQGNPPLTASSRLEDPASFNKAASPD